MASLSQINGQAPFSMVPKRNPKQPFFENTFFDIFYAFGFLLILSYVSYHSLIGSLSNIATNGFPVTSTVGKLVAKKFEACGKQRFNVNLNLNLESLVTRMK